ncbi:RNA methyltransferase [Sediminibacterium roseum]|uniref:RNA methyltransferase n=1 Tax=Sediminibacterium roseum TaxID=1978412 RepID=A0ABW9ZVS7_9BACT|nr:RNA methyltransferase [Sediminibacterium roseum]NCI51254.1 RNA methyltransferase [Sediminibacterium roseum]
MPLPQELLRSLEHVKGFRKEPFEQVHASGEQVTSVRLNPDKAVENDEWNKTPVPWCPYGYYLSSRPSFTLDPLFHAGAYYVQEASSMFLWHALGALIGNDTSKKVLDLCAAPGGKSTLLASYFTDGLVVANEVIKSRAAVLVENTGKWGSDQVIVTNNDPSHFRALPGYFDVMVIDAPCSGSGLFRKDPGAVNEWSEGNVQLCSQRQQRILADVLPALKENGILIYSTCSYSVEEDEAIADWLVTAMNMENRKINIDPSWQIVETQSPVANAYGYRFYPDRVKGEGFFIAAFQKKEAAEELRTKEQALTQLSKQELQQLQSFIELPATFTMFKQGESIRAIRKQWLRELQVLAKCLYIKKAGVEIGSIKGRDVIPAHELALSALAKGFSITGLTKEQALQYLRRKEISLPDAQKGWNLVGFGGLPLGWVKVLPNRVNNYYPAEWRILKE